MSEFGKHTADDKRLAIALAEALVRRHGKDYSDLAPVRPEDFERLASAAITVLASLASSDRLRGAAKELETLRTATIQLEAEAGGAQ
ncbi:MAG TPA: hypothetical protein VIQ52_10450 [Arthrobacter sp.]